MCVRLLQRNLCKIDPRERFTVVHLLGVKEASLHYFTVDSKVLSGFRFVFFQSV